MDDESAYKAIGKEKWLKQKRGDAAVPEPKARDIGRIIVTGCEGRDCEDVESALREYFASCGEITDVYSVGARIVSFAIIYFVGEGAVDKALTLDGSEFAGGWKVRVKPHPFYDDDPILVYVGGFDTWLGDREIEDAVREFCSSCGEVTKVRLVKEEGGYCFVDIKGIDAHEKARELNGSNIGIGRNKADVRLLSKPPRHTTHPRIVCYQRPRRDLPSESNMTAE